MTLVPQLSSFEVKHEPESLGDARGLLTLADEKTSTLELIVQRIEAFESRTFIPSNNNPIVNVSTTNGNNRPQLHHGTTFLEKTTAAVDGRKGSLSG